MTKKLIAYLDSIWNAAMDSYKEIIFSMLEPNPEAKLLDLGCDDGVWTGKLARRMKIRKGQIFGIEIIKERYNLALKKGIMVKESDLNKKFPFKDSYFDVVHANQVIEHIWDLDNFVSEIKRVLKKGGDAIICTENLSSWHNIFALVLGFQPFSLSNISIKGDIGNPLALKAVEGPKFISWQHTRVLSFEGLKDIFLKHGFRVENYQASGYFPFPPFVAKILSKIDKRHAAFPIIKVRKT